MWEKHKRVAFSFGKTESCVIFSAISRAGYASCMDRVAKCYGHGGYIRVIIFVGWGKTLEETAVLQNQVFWGKICQTYVRLLCRKYPNLKELSTFVLQNLVCMFCSV